MPSKAPSPDPLSPRMLAAGLALAGLIVLMAASSPDRSSLGLALACLAGFCILSLFPASRHPAGERTRRPLSQAQAAVPAAAHEPMKPPMKPLADNHKALLATVRERRISRDG